MSSRYFVNSRSFHEGWWNFQKEGFQWLVGFEAILVDLQCSDLRFQRDFESRTVRNRQQCGARGLGNLAPITQKLDKIAYVVLKDGCKRNVTQKVGRRIIRR